MDKLNKTTPPKAVELYTYRVSTDIAQVIEFNNSLPDKIDVIKHRADKAQFVSKINRALKSHVKWQQHDDERQVVYNSTMYGRKFSDFVSFIDSCKVQQVVLFRSSIIRRNRWMQVELQSGDVRKAKREIRDAMQRDVQKKRDKEAKAAIPKQDRKAKIRKERAHKYEYEEQSGKYVPYAMGALGGILGAKVFSTLKKTDLVLDNVNGFMSSMKSFASTLKQQLGDALWVVPFVAVVYYAVRHFGVCGTPVMGVLTSLLVTLIGKAAWAHVSEFFLDGDVELQSGLMDAVPKMMATLFTFSVFKKKMSPMVVTEFCKRISTLDRMSTGWESFISWTMDALEAVVNYTRVAFGKDRISLFKKTMQPTYEWAKKVDKVVCAEVTAANIDSAKLDEMVELIRDGYGFKELYRNTRMSRFIDDYLIKITNVLQPYVGSLNARNNFRFEPAACMLYGPPGIGKTLMAMPLCASVMLLSGLLPEGSTFDDVTKNVWQKGTSEYWNSYANQICLVMDDAFQSRADSTDKENEYLSIIRMVGTWSFPLNFADLQSKGKVFFGSKFIFGTTNLSSFNSEARIVLQEPEAVARRLNFPYTLKLNSEFSLDGKLDYAKFESELIRCKTLAKGLDAFPWHVWSVVKHNFITGQDTPGDIPLRELIVEMSNDLKRRADNHNVTKNFLSDFVSGFQPELQSGDLISPFQTYGCPPLDPYPKVKVTARFFKSKMESWFGKYVNYCKNAELNLRTCLKFIAVGAALRVTFEIVKAVLVGIWKVLASFFKRKDVNHQSNRPVTQTIRGVKYKPNDAVIQSVDTSVVSNVYANTYKMFVEYGNGGKCIIGQVCFINSDLAVQPEHFSANVRRMLRDGEIVETDTIVFRNAMHPAHAYKYSVSHYLGLKRISDADNDVEFVQFTNVRAHRNIVNNFMKELDIKYLSGIRARLDICSIDDNKKIAEVNHRNVFVLNSIKMGTDLPIVNRKLKRYFAYNAPTTVGDCGAPISVFDNSLYSGRCVIGVHVAGMTSRSVGYSSIITQEMIKKALEELEIIDDQFEADLKARGVVMQAGHELPFGVEGSFLSIGVVEKPVVICPVTSYYPTDLFGIIGDYECYPAPLTAVFRDGEKVFPMNNAVKPYATPLLHYEQPWLDQAMYVAMRPLTLLTQDYSRRLYTFDESVLGVPQEKFRSIPRATAAGFPYVYDVKNGKKEFFGDKEDYDLTGKQALELRDRVNHVIESAKRGIRLSHVFVDFFKDELRPKAKVDAVATRLISSAPLDYTIAWRVMFGAFSSAVMRHHTYSGMAPGLCAYSDWSILASRLKEKGKKCFDGDFKAFDSSEQPCVHELILQYINEWYNDSKENQLARRVLWMDLVHSRHIGGMGKDQRFIYQWNKSLPSGHPFTTIVNSMYSLFLLVATYISATGDLVGYWTHVTSVTYGDDNVSNVDDELAEIFNQVTVADQMRKQFGVTYTPGNKTGVFEKYTELENTTFLKRGFSKIDNSWVCPLEKDSFLYTFYWCKNKKLESKIIIDVLETALEELSMHDEHVWSEYAPKLVEVLAMKGAIPRSKCEKKQYLNLIRSRTDNWY